ncbi:MAG: hypothetical protein JNM09_20235 [Blastocatellia bacterium]|nr:hypothetical protein [Blastocatellia bacterium]
MKGILFLFLLVPGWSLRAKPAWQVAEYQTAAQVLKLLNSRTAPAQFYLTTQKTAAGAVVFQVFYQAGTQPSSARWQVRKTVTVTETLDFMNSQGAFAKTPEKEFRICGEAKVTQTPILWIFYRKYEGRTPEAAKGQWNWRWEAFDHAEDVLSFLTRRRSEELLTDVEITGAGDKFYVFYRAPHLYDAPGMSAPVWHWLKRENATSLLEVLNSGTDQEAHPIQVRIAAIPQPSGTAFYLFY